MEVEAPLEQPRIKLVLIGNSGVGKSALLLRLTKESFHLEPSTIGVDFIASTMDLNGVRVKLLIWDTSGQERFAKMASAYYRRTQGVILVYDVSNRASFAALPKWLAEVEQQTSADIVKIIIGNKVDKEASREVSEAEGARFARQHGTLFVEASAKTSEGVRKAFQEVATKIMDTPRSQHPGAASLTTGGTVRLIAGPPEAISGGGCWC